jgi:hypothetical protein
MQLPVSTCKAWADSNGGGAAQLDRFVAGKIDNEDFIRVLDDVRASRDGKPSTFDITPESDPEAWKAIMGGSAFSSIVRAFSDRHTSFGNVEPTKAVAYRPDDAIGEPWVVAYTAPRAAPPSLL